MGVISSALNAALENLGRATMDVGNNGLLAGYNVWEKCCSITVNYLKINPSNGAGGAWGIVTGGIFSISMGIAASLSILFFVIGWLNESIDVRNNFSLENMFRFFVCDHGITHCKQPGASPGDGGLFHGPCVGCECERCLHEGKEG